MKTEAIVNLIISTIIIALTIFILVDYIKLRKSNNESARRLGYGANWRKEISK